MKKIKLLSRLLVLIGVLIMNVSQVWGRQSTVYLAIPEATLGDNHVDLRVNHKGDGDRWGDAGTLSNTGYKYKGKILLSLTFTVRRREAR